MKKVLLFSVLFSFFFNDIAAQDLIELVSGERIEAKVLEVGYEIRYRRADFTDGPVYVLERPEVLMITYSNGYQEIINQEAAQQNNSFAVRESYLRMQANKYYEGFRLISKNEFLQQLQTQPNIYNDFRSGSSMRTAGFVVTGGGILIGLVGMSTRKRDVASQFNNANNFSFNSTLEPPRTGVLWTGMGVSLVGAAIATAGSLKMNRALDEYNIQIGQTGMLRPVLLNDGVGIALRF
jgi:hypothetical protein